MKLFIDNKMYCPISKLQDFKDEDIDSIRIVLESGTIRLYNHGDFIKVDENGNFYYSDYNNGIIKFDKETDTYYEHFLRSKTKLNIVGFYNLKIGGYFKTKEIKETQFEELIRNGK